LLGFVNHVKEQLLTEAENYYQQNADCVDRCSILARFNAAIAAGLPEKPAIH